MTQPLQGRVRRGGVLLGALLVATAACAWRAVKEIRAQRHLNAALAALEAGDSEQARPHLARCLEAWPDSAETHFLAARAARRSGALADAGRLLDEAEQRRWVPEALALERALLQAQQGELPAVEPFLLRCLRGRHPDAPLIAEVLAPAYYRNFRLAEARECLDLWLERRPDSARAWLLKGEVAERYRNRAEAADAYRHVVELDGQQDGPRLRLARVLLGLHRPAEAAEQLDRLVGRRPDDPAVGLGLARCRLEQGRQDEARRILEGLLSQAPDHPAALAELGRLELEAGHPAAAERRLRAAADRTPFEREVLYDLVRSLRRQPDKAAEARHWADRLRQCEADLGRLSEVTKAIVASPHDPELRREAGMLLLRNGQEREGLRWLGSALREDAHHAPTHRALADHFERVGQTRRAALHRSLAEARPKAGRPGPGR